MDVIMLRSMAVAYEIYGKNRKYQDLREGSKRKRGNNQS